MDSSRDGGGGGESITYTNRRSSFVCSAGTIEERTSAIAERPEKLAEDLEAILESGLGADVTFIVGPNKVPIRAHKPILMARSEYFRAMFSAGMQETTMISIEKPNIEPDVFRSILYFIYTGKVRVGGSAAQLLAAADELQLETFKPLIFAASFNETGVSHDNVFRFLDDSLQFNCQSILLYCLEYVETNAYDCLIPEKMLGLSIDALRLVLSRDELDIDEETLFERLVQWAKLSPYGLSPREALEPLVEFIRFPIMDPMFLAREVEPLDIVPREYLVEAYKFFAIPELVNDCHRTQPRRRSWSWDISNSSPLLKFERGVTIISTSDSRWQNAVGSQQFTKGRHYFEVYIAKQKKIDNSWKLNIGVVSDGFDAKKHSVAFGYKMTCPCWCLITGRGETLSHKAPSNGQKGTPYCQPFQEGDSVGVLLDLWTKKIEFFKNGVSMGVAFTDVDESSLRPALSVIGESVLTLRFPRPPKPSTSSSPSPQAFPARVPGSGNSPKE